MRELHVKLPPVPEVRKGSIGRDVVFFLVAFGATFGGALIALDLFF